MGKFLDQVKSGVNILTELLLVVAGSAEVRVY